MQFYSPTKIKVAPLGNKGLGVIALEPIKKDELIERCPIVMMTKGDGIWANEKAKKLRYYILALTDTIFCQIFGYGSFYNHSKTPNCQIFYKSIKDLRKNRHLEFFASRDIRAGEELTIDYNFDGEPWF